MPVSDPCCTLLSCLYTLHHFYDPICLHKSLFSLDPFGFHRCSNTSCAVTFLWSWLLTYQWQGISPTFRLELSTLLSSLAPSLSVTPAWCWLRQLLHFLWRGRRCLSCIWSSLRLGFEERRVFLRVRRRWRKGGCPWLPGLRGIAPTE